ncbi:MAG TPA: nitroreductase family protein [Acidimicrobiales bacterium]|nr:nitroreductase family protein [Acidimicrobiales bacterium]
MDLIETLRTTGAIRDFLPDPVSDDTLARILDTARFAPSGGNRQGWHVVVVKNDATRTALRDLYLPGWYEYLAQRAAGLTPWAPITDRSAEATAIDRAGAIPPGTGFPENLDQSPVVLVLFADLRALAAVDRDLPRYTFAGGASVYPFAWNLLLAARAEGLGGVITTMPIAREAEVKALLDAPDEFALAALIVLGRPVHQPRKLTRAPVSSFVTVDRVTGTAFA